MKSRAEEPGLTFGWPERDRFPWFLFLCVLLSFIAHAASFFVFQVTYPGRASLPPSAPRVHLLTPDRPGTEAVFNWIDAEDPSLVVSANSVTPPNLFDVPYRPSYATMRTPLRSVGETQAAARFPAARNPLTIIRSAESRTLPAASRSEPVPTRVTFSDGLERRRLTQPPAAWSSKLASAPLEPSSYLIGVGDHGEVRFVFLQQTSGDAGIDAEGAAALSSAVFDPGGDAVAWGHATIIWGDELYRASQSAPAQ